MNTKKQNLVDTVKDLAQRLNNWEKMKGSMPSWNYDVGYNAIFERYQKASQELRRYESSRLRAVSLEEPQRESVAKKVINYEKMKRYIA